ncbi:MAG: hypothetical protein OJF50_004083 [Nitrospira sp.]|nr:hypothetical protein [Nitrospira sp.]
MANSMFNVVDWGNPDNISPAVVTANTEASCHSARAEI